MTIETHKIIHCNDTGMQYRVSPNPDCDVPAGRPEGDAGIVLEWRDARDEKWQGYFFVGPNQITELARAMLSFMSPPQTGDEQ